jgi:hypothetical protein
MPLHGVVLECFLAFGVCPVSGKSLFQRDFHDSLKTVKVTFLE